jgi:hypothetical protein
MNVQGVGLLGPCTATTVTGVGPCYVAVTWTTYKTLFLTIAQEFLYCCMFIHCHTQVFTVQLPGSDRSLLAPLFWPSALVSQHKAVSQDYKNYGSCWKILFDKLNYAYTKFYTLSLTFFFRGFPQPHQGSASWLDHSSFLQNPFQFIPHSSIQYCIVWIQMSRKINHKLNY